MLRIAVLGVKIDGVTAPKFLPIRELARMGLVAASSGLGPRARDHFLATAAGRENA